MSVYLGTVEQGNEIPLLMTIENYMKNAPAGGTLIRPRRLIIEGKVLPILEKRAKTGCDEESENDSTNTSQRDEAEMDEDTSTSASTAASNNALTSFLFRRKKC